MNHALSEIAGSVESQTEGISRISGAVAQLNRTTQSQAVNAEHAASAAEQLKSDAASVRELTAVLHQVIEGSASTAQ